MSNYFDKLNNKNGFANFFTSKKDKEVSEKEEKKLVSTKPVSILFTIVGNKKAEYYADIIQGYQVNMQMITVANGTTKSTVFVDEVGTKSVIISFILDENIKKCLQDLQEKFATVKGGKGVAYTVPLTSVAGVRLYNFLSNNQNRLI